MEQGSGFLPICFHNKFSHAKRTRNSPNPIWYPPRKVIAKIIFQRRVSIPIEGVPQFHTLGIEGWSPPSSIFKVQNTRLLAPQIPSICLNPAQHLNRPAAHWQESPENEAADASRIWLSCPSGTQGSKWRGRKVYIYGYYMFLCRNDSPARFAVRSSEQTRSRIGIPRGLLHVTMPARLQMWLQWIQDLHKKEMFALVINSAINCKSVFMQVRRNRLCGQWHFWAKWREP